MFDLLKIIKILESPTKLPKIPKAADEREAIEAALLNNAFMRNLQRDQVEQVPSISRLSFLSALTDHRCNGKEDL